MLDNLNCIVLCDVVNNIATNSTQSHSINYAIADSGANNHYLPYTNINDIINVEINDTPITVNCANNSKMTSTHTGELNIESIPYDG